MSQNVPFDNNKIIEAAARGLCEAENGSDCFADFDKKSKSTYIRLATATVQAAQRETSRQIAEHQAADESIILTGDDAEVKR